MKNNITVNQEKEENLKGENEEKEWEQKREMSF